MAKKRVTLPNFLSGVIRQSNSATFARKARFRKWIFDRILHGFDSDLHMVLRSLFLHFQYCSTRSAGPLLILLNQIYIICFPGPVVLASPPLSSLQFKCLVRPTGPLFGHGLSILNPVQCHRGLALFKLFMSRGRDGDPFARMADVSIPPKWPSSKTMTVLADEKSTSLQEPNTLTHANYV